MNTMGRTSKSVRARDGERPEPLFRTRAEIQAFLRETAEAVAQLPD